MLEHRFDIFSGSPDNEPLWLEVTDGLADAIEQMVQRASTKPGCYFVYEGSSRTVVASIDTEMRVTCSPNG